MEKLFLHFYTFAEAYMLLSAFLIAFSLLALLFYELKKYPNLVLELRNQEDEKE